MILKHGVIIKEKLFTITIKCFLCDTPAFVKCTKGHGGYFSCERCITKGERFKNRTVYPNLDKKRTDASFRRLSTHRMLLLVKNI